MSTSPLPPSRPPRLLWCSLLLPGAPGGSRLGRTTLSGLLKHLGQVWPWGMSSPSHCPMRGQVQQHKCDWSAVELRCRARHRELGPAQGCPALGASVYRTTPTSPQALYPFGSKGNLENVNQASEPCLPLGPGAQAAMEGVRDQWSPVGGPSAGPGFSSIHRNL